MVQCSRYVILVYGLVETFIFTGNIFGWAALNYMLKQEGVYEDRCATPVERGKGFYDSADNLVGIVTAAAGGPIIPGDGPFAYSDIAYNASGAFILRNPAFAAGYVVPDDGALKTKGRDGTRYGGKSAILKHQSVPRFGTGISRDGHQWNLTSPETLTLNMTIGGRMGCSQQDKVLNLAFTIGSFCIGFTAFIWGFLLDRWGLRVVRLIINGMVTSGTILLSLTGRDTSYLVFPALSLMCLAGVPLRLANMQIANLFPRHRSTVITLYSGAFSASASVFVFIKYAFDAGLPWEWSCVILIVMSAFMFPVTLFMLPAHKITEPDCKTVDGEEGRQFYKGIGEIAVISPAILGKFSSLPTSPFNTRKLEKGGLPAITFKTPQKVDPTPPEKPPKEVTKEPPKEIPLKTTLFSFSYLMHQYWFCWLLLYTIIYVGTLHLWLERIVSDIKEAAKFTAIYGLFQAAGLFLAPLGGVVMDRAIHAASTEPDPDTRRLRILQSPFWPMLATTATEAVAQACKFFDNDIAVYISIVFVTLLRSFFIAIGTAYLRIRFPACHFNRLLGIMSTASAVFTLLQFPLFLWEAKSEHDVLHVNIFNSICLLVAFIHPILMFVTPIQRFFIRKEKEVALKYLGQENPDP